MKKNTLFSVTSTVHKGLGNGKKIGYPTINLVYPEHSDFETGVYVCNVQTADESWYGVMHLGPRHTVDGENTFEIHLLDFNERELNGVECKVDVLQKIRDVKRFTSMEDLKNAISNDVEKAKVILSK